MYGFVVCLTDSVNGVLETQSYDPDHLAQFFVFGRKRSFFVVTKMNFKGMVSKCKVRPEKYLSPIGLSIMSSFLGTG